MADLTAVSFGGAVIDHFAGVQSSRCVGKLILIGGKRQIGGLRPLGTDVRRSAHNLRAIAWETSITPVRLTLGIEQLACLPQEPGFR
jgi:hypothetical protein